MHRHRPCLAFLAWLLPLASPMTSEARTEKTKVFYVGGFRASPEQVSHWARCASSKAPQYDFEGVPYPPGAGAGFEAAVQGAAGSIRRIVAEINGNPGRRYVIAGHSSGAAISNTIASRVGDKSRIRQVVLDGFTSPRIPGTTCWGALGRNGKPSRNLGAMGSCGSGKRVYHDSHCSSASQWCLHFSVVLKDVPANLANFRADGYRGCDANLDWLD